MRGNTTVAHTPGPPQTVTAAHAKPRMRGSPPHDWRKRTGPDRQEGRHKQRSNVRCKRGLQKQKRTLETLLPLCKRSLSACVETNWDVRNTIPLQKTTKIRSCTVWATCDPGGRCSLATEHEACEAKEATQMMNETSLFYFPRMERVA